MDLIADWTQPKKKISDQRLVSSNYPNGSIEINKN